MATWLDPEFDDGMARAARIAAVEVVDSTPDVTRVRVQRVLAGASAAAGDVLAIARAATIGVGHASDVVAAGAYVIAVGAGDRAITDTYGWFPIMKDDGRVHVPIRDPFTRAYVELEDLVAFATLLRDRAQSPASFLARHLARLAETPVVATQPIEVNEQIVALEAVALLGDASHAAAVLPYLASPHFQIRWSCARALGTCGATRALEAQLAREDVPPVQAALALALARPSSTPLDRDALQRALPRLAAKPFLLSRNLMNPVMNELAAPRATISALLA